MINFKIMILSGLISGVIGGVIGFGAGQIALRQNVSQVRTDYSQGYRYLYNHKFVWVGAIAGFIMGMGQSCVLQMKEEQDKEREQKNQN